MAPWDDGGGHDSTLAEELPLEPDREEAVMAPDHGPAYSEL